jgi:hypothetical protein
MKSNKLIIPSLSIANHLCRIGLIAMALVTFCAAGKAGAQQSNADKIKDALKLMHEQTAKLGDPKLDGAKLYFGTTKVNGNYDIVDALKQQFGCSATFFAKKGDDFVRISTNVLNDGNRAVGTVLDPKGPAYAAISKGEAYYGQVLILGKKYEAGYEPVKDATGATIGVYYIGFLQEQP